MTEQQCNPFAHLTEYELYHLVEHLIIADRLEDALSIVKPKFREIKVHRFASDFAFRQDLELIIDHFEDTKPADSLPATMRCSLIHSLLTSLAVQIPPEVLAAFVHFGEGDRAIQIATLSPIGEEKANQFLAIGKALAESQASTETIKYALQEALRITRSLARTAEGTRDLLRTEIAKYVAHLDWDWCQRILGEIEHSHIRSQSKIIIAAEIADDQTKAVSLMQEVLPTIEYDSPLTWELSNALARVAHYHLDAVQSLIESIENRRLQDLIRREVAKRLLENGLAYSALRVAEGIVDSHESLHVLGQIAGCLADENIEETRKIVDQIPSTPEGVRALINLVNSLSPEHAELALEIANAISDAKDRCQALAQTALLFARARDLPQTRRVLTIVLNTMRCLSTSDISYAFASSVAGKTIAQVALIDEETAMRMLSEWEPQEYSQHVASQVCGLVLVHNVDLALRISELISHPLLKANLLAQAMFHLPSDTKRVKMLQKQVVDLTKAATDDEYKRQLEAYLVASRGLDSPEHLLSIWKEEVEPKEVSETELPTTIIIAPPDVDHPIRDKFEERDNFFTSLALDVSLTDSDQALIILHCVLDKNRRIRGLAKLACFLSKRIGTVNTDEDKVFNFQRRRSLAEDVSGAAAQLAKDNVRLALKIVQAIPTKDKLAQAYAAVALAIQDKDLEQGQLLLEKALAVSQKRPRTALKAIAYLELDKCLLEENQKVDLIEKSLSLLSSDTIPGAVPEVTKHIVTHLAKKGREEIALRIAERMPTTHAILDTPHKMQTLLKVAKHALEHEKLDIGKRALDQALDVLQLSSYCSPSLPRLASLIRRYNPQLADQLFNSAIEIAMSKEMHGPSRFHILGGVAHFRAPFNSQFALKAARKISDPYTRADALLDIITQGTIPPSRREEIIMEVRELLAVDHGDAVARGRALLKLADTKTPEQPEYRELLWNIVETARLAPPGDWLTQIGFLVEVYERLKKLGDQKAAREVMSVALDTARNDPFNWSAGLAQMAKLHLSHKRSTAIAILYETLQRARLEGYDAVWTAITAIIPVMCEIGGSDLAQHVYEELCVAEEFLPNRVRGLDC
jgi:hypothetical protein